MTRCSACGIDNADGTAFCVNCGAQLPAAAPSTPPPAYDAPPTYQPGSSGSYPPPAQPPMQVPQPVGPQEPMQPIIAALLSLLVPGLGLIFFPNKKQLGIYMLVGTFGGVFVLTAGYFLITFITAGIGGILGCCFFLLPLWNIFAALYTHDLAAKEIGGGKYNPLIFK